MQVLMLRNGRVLMIPKDLPAEYIADLSISMNVPVLHARQVRVMPLTIALVCCDCAEHLLAEQTLLCLN